MAKKVVASLQTGGGKEHTKVIKMIKTEIKPFGIDLSSGVEKELGIKNNQNINNFMDKFNNA